MKDGLEELSARSRRGELSSAEQRQFERLLEASLEGRLWHRAGCEFDEQSQVLPGDHAAAERVLRRLVATLPKERRRPSRRVAFLLIAAVLCLASISTATVIGLRHFTKLGASDSSAAPTTLVTVSELSHGASPTKPESTKVEVPQISTSSEPARPRAPSATGAVSAGRRAVKLGATNEAAELFSAAARARREGDIGKAVALYGSLQNQYPNSSESRASDITLGMLHLKRGAPNLALEHFRRYLRHSPRSELAAEALWGESQALNALGRQADARRSLAILLERYPNSAYTEAARTKLLTGSTAP